MGFDKEEDSFYKGRIGKKVVAKELSKRKLL